MSSRGGGGAAASAASSGHTAYYERLGLTREATLADVRKAFFVRAKRDHPDKGGDPEKFKSLTKAYECLSNPDLRAAYDRGGEDAVGGGGGGGGGGESAADDIMSMLFGGGGRTRPAAPKRTEDMVHPFPVSLEDLFFGRAIRISVSRSAYVRSEGGAIQDRAGHRYEKRSETVVLSGAVERGMRHGQRLRFVGQGDQLPGMAPGDVVLVLEEQRHALFQRKGCDLIYRKSLTLLEAITGARFVVEHFRGRRLFCRAAPGEVLRPDALRQVRDEGMPIYGMPHVRGVLLIQFDVQFPERLELSEAMRRVLTGILPAPPEGIFREIEPGMVAGEYGEVDLTARAAREKLSKEAYDSDEDANEGGSGGKPMACAPQ